jgi:4-amino-4-deoxy-L-arabinose transferase-like glycosyltransferase
VPPPRDLAILLALVALLLLGGLGRAALTDRDEGANAGAAREMLEQGAWITPTLDYWPRFAKPAFVYWLMVGAYRLLGVGETAARLPSALAAAGLVFVQYGFARWALGGAVALRAAVVLLTSLLFVALGRMALTDATLVLWTTVAGFAFFRAHTGPAPRRRFYAIAWIALALAMLTKGPVGVLVPVLGIVVYLALTGGGRRVMAEAGVGWGLVLFLTLAGPWYAAMFWIHGADYAARAQGETLGRVFRAVTGPGGTALFYIPVLLVGMFPWSAALPGVLLGALRGARARAVASRAGATAVFAAAWVASGFVLFSLLQSRLPHYVAPLVPPAALLVAAGWPGPWPALTRGLLATVGAFLGLAAITARGLGTIGARLLAPAYPADPQATLPAASVAIGLLAMAMATLALVRKPAPRFRSLTVLTLAFLAVGLHLAVPAFSRDFVAPAGDLARRAAALAAPCDEVVAFGPYRPSLLFYARRPLTFVDLPDRSRLAELAARPGRLLLVVPRAHIGLLPAAVGALPEVERQGGYALLQSAPSAPACVP